MAPAMRVLRASTTTWYDAAIGQSETLETIEQSKQETAPAARATRIASGRLPPSHAACVPRLSPALDRSLRQFRPTP